ncbi:MAG: hypothetical protein LBS96_01755 [Oscillospiraceae bacterium]|jgi:hypothetical protein|nr:hypothetical protein [Oscillospiraceae bacterium]
MVKKILAAVLSILALLSVMTAVVYATGVEKQQAALALDAADDDLTVPSTETTEPGVTRPEWADQFESFWKVFYPIFDLLYKNGFVLLSQGLATAVNFIITSLFS